MISAMSRVASVIILAGSLVGIGPKASAQFMQSANIVILPSASANVSDRITARISHTQVACYGFTPSLSALPGGVFEITYSAVGSSQPPSCTQTFDVDLGILPQGNYSVVFRPIGPDIIATSSFFVGIAAIPTIGNLGLFLLALLIAFAAKLRLGGGSLVMRKLLTLSCVLATMGLLSPHTSNAATAIDDSGRHEVIIRYDRALDSRSAAELAEALNNKSDLQLAARLSNPTTARRLMRREPTSYETEIISKYPTALVTQLFEYVVLTYESRTDIMLVAERLRQTKELVSVELPIPIKLSTVNDPYLGTLGSSSNASQWGLHALAFPDAWVQTKGHATIAFIDTGLVTTHEDLAGNFRKHLSINLTSVLPGNLDATYLEDEYYLLSTSPNTPGHGTHVAGILAATTDNATGIAGGCPKCSLIAVKNSRFDTGTLVNEIDFAIAAGAQVINFSAEFSDTACVTPASDPRAWCKALKRALDTGITVVAAAGNSGNYGDTYSTFGAAPAASEGVLAIGGLQPGPGPADTSGQVTFWQGKFVFSSGIQAVFGSDVQKRNGYYFLAPAAQVLSTFPQSATYNSFDPPYSQWGCADALGFPNTPGYGNCTGTSMAAPHVAAIAGLMRSAQPTLGYAATANLIRSTSGPTLNVQSLVMLATNAAPYPASVPNANLAVQAALGGSINRLTPLFSFWSGSRGHFYTSSPQAGKAAIAGTLIPNPNSQVFAPIGNNTEGYGCFPPDMADTSPISCTGGNSPRALIEVYTTENSPYGGALIPLYRLSISKVVGISATTRHVYETDEARKASFIGQGWKVDGIEGYVLPSLQPGAQKLCRKYSAALEDYVMFPGDDCSAQTDCTLSPNNCGPASGYSSSVFTDFIGYVFPSRNASDSDGDGLPDYLEFQEGRNYLAKDNDVFADTVPSRRLFVMEQYRDFLGREGDSGGLISWTNYLTQNPSNRPTVIEQFFLSQEFQGVIAPVARLYFAFFLRIPDYTGLDYWTKQSRAGTSPLSSIADAFASSAEFQNRYGTLTNQDYVRQLYVNVFGREPDQGGLNYWLGQLNGGVSRGQVMLGFSESAEYQATSSSRIYVTMMYVGMLRRAPDQGGFDFWVGYLNGGQSGQALIGGFLSSPEYRLRFLP